MFASLDTTERLVDAETGDAAITALLEMPPHIDGRLSALRAQGDAFPAQALG